MRKLILAAVALIAAFSVARPQDVINTYVGVAAQIKDGIITTAKFVSTTGTAGTAVVLATSPSLTTPTIGVATATSVNKVAITAPATSATLTITDGQTLSYTEGTWSPTLVGSATPGTGQTYNSQVGSYEQIGRQVTLRFNIQATSLGTAAGNLQIGNIPFANSGTTNHNGNCFMSFYTATGLAALNYGLGGNLSAGTSLITVQQYGSTGSSALTVAQAGATVILIGFCTYHV